MVNAGRLGFEDLSVRLESRTVLYRVTLALEENQTTVLMGPGGSGKSTLAGFLVGKLPDARHIEISGATYRPAPRAVAWLPQRIARTAKSAAAVLMEQHGAMLSSEDIAQWQAYLQREQLPSLADALHSDEPLAPPELQTLRLAVARRQQPELMVIDEPCAGMFNGTDELVLRYLEKINGKQTILMLTHHQARSRRLADTVILMAAGQIIEVAPTETFFSDPASPHTRHYLRTGGCSVVSADANVMLDPEADRERNASYTAEQPVVPTPPVSIGEAAEGDAAQDITRDESGASFPAQAALDSETRAAEVAASAALTPPLGVPPVPTEPTPAGRAPSLVEAARIAPRARGPEGFYWLVSDELAGCPMPGIVEPIERDLDRLARAGVKVLVTLQTRPLIIPEGAQDFIPQVLHFPIVDMEPPELDEAIAFCRKVEEYVHRGEPIAYHCRAGLGRTGTMLVSHLIGRGMQAGEALEFARAINGRWVQSQAQEDFLQTVPPGFLLTAD